jgi:hypothetical protein
MPTTLLAILFGFLLFLVLVFAFQLSVLTGLSVLLAATALVIGSRSGCFPEHQVVLWLCFVAVSGFWIGRIIAESLSLQ